MKKFKIVSALLGEDKSGFIVEDLKKSYKQLKRDLKDKNSIPIFSYDRKE